MALAVCEHCRLDVGETEEWVKVTNRLYHLRCWSLLRWERRRSLN